MQASPKQCWSPFPITWEEMEELFKKFILSLYTDYCHEALQNQVQFYLLLWHCATLPAADPLDPSKRSFYPYVLMIRNDAY